MLASPGLSLAGAIVQIAHSLGIDPIAEGVENQEQADTLRTLGCDLAQGYHLGRPLVASAALELLTRTKAAIRA